MKKSRITLTVDDILDKLNEKKGSGELNRIKVQNFKLNSEIDKLKAELIEVEKERDELLKDSGHAKDILSRFKNLERMGKPSLKMPKVNVPAGIFNKNNK